MPSSLEVLGRVERAADADVQAALAVDQALPRTPAGTGCRACRGRRSRCPRCPGGRRSAAPRPGRGSRCDAAQQRQRDRVVAADVTAGAAGSRSSSAARSIVAMASSMSNGLTRDVTGVGDLLGVRTGATSSARVVGPQQLRRLPHVAGGRTGRPGGRRRRSRTGQPTTATSACSTWSMRGQAREGRGAGEPRHDGGVDRADGRVGGGAAHARRVPPGAQLRNRRYGYSEGPNWPQWPHDVGGRAGRRSGAAPGGGRGPRRAGSGGRRRPRSPSSPSRGRGCRAASCSSRSGCCCTATTTTSRTSTRRGCPRSGWASGRACATRWCRKRLSAAREASACRCSPCPTGCRSSPSRRRCSRCGRGGSAGTWSGRWPRSGR